MNKQGFFFIVLMIAFFNSFCQKVDLISISQLHERVSKGEDTTYIINFWATWCAPCLKELPFFEKLQMQFKEQKLKVLLISVDFKSKLGSSVEPFVKRNKLNNEVFLLDEKDQQEYIARIDKNWSGAIPATLFIKNENRKFIESDFTYPDLLREYQLISNL
jgi:thiol-disulfide isomerase/thioredoxin